MSLAYSLAASLAETETEADLTTLVIDHYTRTIQIPKGITTLGVEHDDDVLRLNFKMARYLGTVDLYNFDIRINYLNAEGEGDVYQVTDKTVVGGNITFSWLVGPTATKYKGSTKFNVCMVIADQDSVVKQEYNTAIASLPVQQGLETSQRAVSTYSDILMQWESRLFGIGDTEEANLVAASEAQQAAIANKGAEILATIPEDYTSTYNLANHSARTKADAIICSVKGETIAVSDASDDNLRGLKLLGKTTQVTTNGYQLFDASTLPTTTSGNVTVTNNGDGSFTISGSDTLTAVCSKVKAYTHEETVALLKRAGTFYFTCDRITMPYFYVALWQNGASVREIHNWNNTKSSFDVTEEMLNDDTFIMRIGFYGTANKGITKTTVRPMLYADGDGTWEPYTGGVASPSPEWPQELHSVGSEGDVKLYVNGNNFFNPNNATNIPSTTTVGEDGWVTVNVPANGNNPFSNLFTPSDDRIIVGKEYVIACEVKEITNGTLHYMSIHTEPGGSSQFHKTYSADTVGTFKTVATARYTTNEALHMLRSHFGITDLTVPAKCVYRIWVYPAELGDIEYEPYTETQTVSLSHTLPGIPVSRNGNYTDPTGQQWICDEIDFERGVYVKNVSVYPISYVYTPGITKTSNGLKWSYGTSVKDSALHLKGASAINYLMNTKFQMVLQTLEEEEHTGTVMSAYGHSDNLELRFRLLVSEYETADLVEQTIKDTVVYYPLANPIETPLSADEIAAFQALKTNYPNTIVLNDAGADMCLRYNADTETWITNLIDEKIAAAVAKL